MRILVKAGEMRFHHLHVHPEYLHPHLFFLILMAQSGCCCWAKGTLSTITVHLEIEMTLVCFKHSQKDSSESLFLLPVFAFKWKRQTQAPGNSPTIKIDIAVVFLKRPIGFSLTAAALFIPSWTKNCVWQLLLLDKTSLPVHLRWNPQEAWGRLIAAHVSSSLQNTWMLPHNQTTPHRNGPETNLKPEHSLKSFFLNYAADSDIFTLTPVFRRSPLAFEYSSVCLLSLIQPTARSLDSASNIYVEHEHPGQPDCVSGMWRLCTIGGDSAQSDIVADRWCKSLMPFLAAQNRSGSFPFCSLTMWRACSCI